MIRLLHRLFFYANKRLCFVSELTEHSIWSSYFIRGSKSGPFSTCHFALENLFISKWHWLFSIYMKRNMTYQWNHRVLKLDPWVRLLRTGSAQHHPQHLSLESLKGPNSRVLSSYIWIYLERPMKSSVIVISQFFAFSAGTSKCPRAEVESLLWHIADLLVCLHPFFEFNWRLGLRHYSLKGMLLTDNNIWCAWYTSFNSFGLR